MRPRTRNPGLPLRMVFFRGSYFYLQPLGGTRSKWISLGQDKARALHKYADIVAEMQTERLGNFPEFVDGWMKHPRGFLRYREKTQEEYKRMAGHIKKWFRQFDVEQVRPVHVARALDAKFPDKARSYNAYKALFSILFAHAAHVGLRDDNPAQMVRGVEEKKRDRYITDPELKAIIAAARIGKDGRETPSGQMVVCLIALGYVTAQRIGDLLRLKWSDVREDGIYFRPAKTVNSTGVRLLIRMTPALKAILDKAKGVPSEANALYVIHTLEGRPYKYSGARTAWDRACERAGVTDAHFHDLRAKALTDAKRAGLDAQTMAGHADPKMTAHYTKSREVVEVQPLEIAA